MNNSLTKVIASIIIATAETKLSYIEKNNPKSAAAFLEKLYGELGMGSPKDNSYVDMAVKHITNELPFPDPTGAYTAWIALKYPVESSMKIEDIPHKIGKALDEYNILKIKVQNKTLKLPEFKSDINSFKTFVELEDYVEKYSSKTDDKDYSKALSTEAAALFKNGDAEISLKSGPVTIIKLITFKASIYFSSGTKWCTSDKSMFDMYSNQSPLYAIFTPDGRYQFHMESKQYMDIKDREVELSKFLEKYPQVLDFFKNKNVDFLVDPTEEQFMHIINSSTDSPDSEDSIFNINSDKFRKLHKIASELSAKCLARLLAGTLSSYSAKNGMIAEFPSDKPINFKVLDALLELPSSQFYNRKTIFVLLRHLAENNPKINTWFLDRVTDKTVLNVNPFAMEYHKLSDSTKAKILCDNPEESFDLVETVKVRHDVPLGRGRGSKTVYQDEISNKGFEVILKMYTSLLKQPEYVLLAEDSLNKLIQNNYRKLNDKQIDAITTIIESSGYYALASHACINDNYCPPITNALLDKLIIYNTDKNFEGLDKKFGGLAIKLEHSPKQLDKKFMQRLYLSNHSGPIVIEFLKEIKPFNDFVIHTAIKSTEEALSVLEASPDAVYEGGVPALYRLSQYAPQAVSKVLKGYLDAEKRNIFAGIVSSEATVGMAEWFVSELKKLELTNKTIENFIKRVVYHSAINCTLDVSKVVLLYILNDLGLDWKKYAGVIWESDNLAEAFLNAKPETIFKIVPPSEKSFAPIDREYITYAISKADEATAKKITNRYKLNAAF